MCEPKSVLTLGCADVGGCRICPQWFNVKIMGNKGWMKARIIVIN